MTFERGKKQKGLTDRKLKKKGSRKKKACRSNRTLAGMGLKQAGQRKTAGG